MCGIFGVWNYESREAVDRELVVAARDSMRHRGRMIAACTSTTHRAWLWDSDVSRSSTYAPRAISR